MAVTQYIGARYVPLIMGEWIGTQPYEPLSVVTYQGNSYTSKQAVPANIDIANEDYWILSGNYNAQVEAYRQEVQQFDGRITENADNIEAINDNAWIEEKNLTNDVKLLHSNATETFVKAYIDKTNGDDSTAAIDDETKPFKTLEAAADALNKKGNHFDFRFLTPGLYKLPYKVFVGAVIHFRAPENTSGTVTIEPGENLAEGGFYFYDTHVNFMGTSDCPIHFNATDQRLIEVEGSTLWTDFTVLTCQYLILNQGSSRFKDTTINGYLAGAFNNILCNRIRINNKLAYPAIRLSTSRFRTVSTAEVYIGRNPNEGAANHPAIYFESSYVTLSTQMNSETNCGYQRFFDARASIITALDEWITRMDTYAPEASQFISLSTLIKANTVLPQS